MYFFCFFKGGSLASADVKALRATRILEQGHAFCNWKGRQVLTLDNEEEAKFKAIEETLALELVEAFQKELDLPSLDDSNNEEGRPELEEEENKNVEPQKSGGGGGGKKSKNVAMAAILRQATTTTTGSGSELAASERQVTFKTPSPNLSEDSGSQISQEDSRFVFLKNYLKIVIIFFSKLLILYLKVITTTLHDEGSSKAKQYATTTTIDGLFRSAPSYHGQHGLSTSGCCWPKV